MENKDSWSKAINKLDTDEEKIEFLANQLVGGSDHFRELLLLADLALHASVYRRVLLDVDFTAHLIEAVEAKSKSS